MTTRTRRQALEAPSITFRPWFKEHPCRVPSCANDDTFQEAIAGCDQTTALRMRNLRLGRASGPDGKPDKST